MCELLAMCSRTPTTVTCSVDDQGWKELQEGALLALRDGEVLKQIHAGEQ